MSYSVTDIKTDLSGVLHGTTINKITNLAGLMSRAGRQLLLDCNPIETKRIAQLGQVFNSVYDYAPPSDLKGVQVIDIRPQAGRWPTDQYEQAFARWFDANKRNGWNNSFNIQHDTGVKTLRIEAPTLPPPVVITDTGSVTGWTLAAPATNLSVDTQFNVAGSGALQYDQTASGGDITNTTLSPVDLSEHEDISTLFFWFYMPTVVTSVAIYWGSSVSDYWDSAATTQQDGTAFKAGWNLIAIPWSGATSNGTPDASVITYFELFTTGGGAMTGLKLDYVTSALPQYLEMVYYSKYLFSNTGVWQEKIIDTDSADLLTVVNLDTESYNLYFNLLSYYVCQQLQGADAQKDSQFFMSEYQRSLKRYTAMYKSETLLPSEPWYQIGRNHNQTGPRWFV